MLFLEVGASALGGAGDGFVQEDALAGQGGGDAAHVLGAAADEADAAGADQAAGVGGERLVLGEQLTEDAHVLQDLDGRLAHGVAAVLVARELGPLQQQRLGPAPRQVVASDRAGGAGAHNGDVVVRALLVLVSHPEIPPAAQQQQARQQAPGAHGGAGAALPRTVASSRNGPGGTWLDCFCARRSRRLTTRTARPASRASAVQASAACNLGSMALGQEAAISVATVTKVKRVGAGRRDARA